MRVRIRLIHILVPLLLTFPFWLVAGEEAGDSARLVNEGVRLFDEYKVEDALEKFSAAALIDEKRGPGFRDLLANDYAWIGRCHETLGAYDRALEYYGKARAIFDDLGLKDKASRVLYAQGKVFYTQGRFDKAVLCFEQALSIDEALGLEGQSASDLNALGAVYSMWTQFDKALEYYRRALEIAIRLGEKGLLASCLSNLGWVYSMQGRPDLAVECFNRALAIDMELGDKAKIAVDLMSIGTIHRDNGEIGEAIASYEKALAMSRETGDSELEATCLFYLGDLNQGMQKYNIAIGYYRESLAIDQALGRSYETAECLKAIGTIYYENKFYRDAEKYFFDSIAIIEKIRLTATGAVRRDYLESQIQTYRWLVSANIRAGMPDRAFDTVELSSAKYLAEQMGGRMGLADLSFEGCLSYQKKIGVDEAVVCLVNTDWSRSAIVLFSRDTIFALEADKEPFIADVNKFCGPVIDELAAALRGPAAVAADDSGERRMTSTREDFDNIIGFYRYLLSRPELDSDELAMFRRISRGLYDLFLEPLELYLLGKTKIRFILDGILSFVPLETLLLPDGRYLVEKYHMSYTQSLTVRELAVRRDYSPGRKSLLAFGGAVYDELSYERDMAVSEQQLAFLREEVALAQTRGASLRSAYGELGIGKWKNLPGSLSEAKAVGSIAAGSVVFTGGDVSEENVKKLSKSGALKGFRVIHFATHGLVVPEIPELSAVVLSQFREGPSNEDGYLTMREISLLDINADFVNLSACETGLGKIYGGEGVVGLTQAFLVAGANGVSVSLWQVSDESTMRFMTEFYALLGEGKTDYSGALTEMKRRFINRQNAGGADYRAPFFWAPFVYYGK